MDSYAPPSEPQTSFTDIAGDNITGLAASSASPNGMTAINNIAYTAGCAAGTVCHDKILQVMRAGAKYAVTDKLDVIGALLSLFPEQLFRDWAKRRLLEQCSLAMLRNVRCGFHRYRLAVRSKVGHLRRLHVLTSEWRLGERLSPARQHRSHGRAALPDSDRGRDFVRSPSGYAKSRVSALRGLVCSFAHLPFVTCLCLRALNGAIA